MTYKDFFGNQIKAGDWIVYSCNVMGNEALKVGYVKELTTQTMKWGQPKPIKIPALNCIIAEYNDHAIPSLKGYEKVGWRVSRTQLARLNKVLVVRYSDIPKGAPRLM